MNQKAKPIKIAAIGDIHIEEDNPEEARKLFTDISLHADILVLAGDLTHTGAASEAAVLAQELESCTIPVVAVLGNHDYQNNQYEEIKRYLMRKGVRMLDGQPVEINGVGFAGVKGFSGGFDNRTMPAFGEYINKQFVQETINEVLKLETALSLLSTEKKVVVLHYSPIKATVEGEPPEIFPFLGSSRLAEPIDLFGANVVFHGHAHMGSFEGKTLKGIPVYNVSYALMKKKNPTQPYALIEI
jgi:uncharacterized protein